MTDQPDELPLFDIEAEINYRPKRFPVGIRVSLANLEEFNGAHGNLESGLRIQAGILDYRPGIMEGSLKSLGFTSGMETRVLLRSLRASLFSPTR